ncbi:hypothetical protein GCM10009836_71670 [Pseudonocardia ailaonensis]|uniref:Uncharacterized protein n=1 Tax=Pseudonocardia ailaonensis TaxID=367279 RepID=A0ABN2NQ01_9PSEU
MTAAISVAVIVVRSAVNAESTASARVIAWDPRGEVPSSIGPPSVRTDPRTALTHLMMAS